MSHSAAAAEPGALPPSESASSELASLSTETGPSLEYHHHKQGIVVGPGPLLSSSPDHTTNNLPALNVLIRQDPFSLTLDATALLGCSICLLLALHFVPRLLVESTIFALPLLLLLHHDYQNFLSLGPGGTPPTWAGYARLTWLRLFILRDPLSPPRPDQTAVTRPPTGILPRQNLPYRSGPRPTVAGLAPQRQLDQLGSHGAAAALQDKLSRLAVHDPARFGTATSYIEKHGFALFARHPVNVCGNGEVCHLHYSDRSLHLNLHPEDIAVVLSKGWGERHPLAWRSESKKEGGWLNWLRVRSPLPETFVLIYAPRAESEFDVVIKIIEASIWYAVEERVDLASL